SLIGASSFIAIGPYSQFVGIKCLRCTKKMGALGSQRGYEKQLLSDHSVYNVDDSVRCVEVVGAYNGASD
ncbi:MAG: hypothetical protein ACI9Y1_000685, partial [Lentisphaeria bacterium]